jgi:hypothetical protein
MRTNNIEKVDFGAAQVYAQCTKGRSGEDRMSGREQLFDCRKGSRSHARTIVFLLYLQLSLG